MQFTFEDEAITCAEGDTIASALIGGPRGWRESPEGLRGLYCGMGICHECAVVVDGAHGMRACMTLAHDGMEVHRQPERVKPGSLPETSEERVLKTQVLVIGAGPAG